MKTLFFFVLLGLITVAGCVSTSDLEELGASLQGNQETLELKLTDQQNQDRQAFQSGIENLQGSIESGLKKQETQFFSRIDELGRIQKQDVDDLRKEIQGGDQNLESTLKEEFNKSLAELQIRIVSSLLKQEQLQKEMEAMKVELSALKSAHDDEMKKINFELKEINEAINISRSIQDVQVSFGSIKNRLEDSRTRVESQELILRQLEGQMQRTERSNLLLEKDIRVLEGRMKELLELMEQRQQKNSTRAEESETVQKLEGRASD